jgi:hypothetical protein
MSSSSLGEEDLLDFSSDSFDRVTPWSEYNPSDQSAIVRFDDFRFPLSICHLSDKVVWRGLEEHAGWTLPVLFERMQSFWQGRNVPVGMKGFMEYFGCKIQTNLGCTTVYIGMNDSYCSMSAQDAALAFQNLLEFLVGPRVKTVPNMPF